MLILPGTAFVSDLVLEQLSLLESTPEAKEKLLLRNVEVILDIALPKVPVFALAVEQDTPSIDVNTDPKSSVPGDAVYAHSRFDENGGGEQIRLLELLPGKATDTVQAKTFIIDSPRHHDYEALSYAWGLQDVRHEIMLNGQPYTVGPNLHDALMSLRLPDRVRHLWVDALCINQKDDDEKAVQIGLMGTIYCEARNVAIFLGMPTARSYTLFEFLNRKERTEGFTHYDGLAIIKACNMDVAAVVASFVEFCDREWWNRVWVMQETYLAARPPVWYIGSNSFEGERLCRDVKVLSMEAMRITQPFGHPKDLSAAVGEHTMSSLLEKVSDIIEGVLLRRETKAYNIPRMLFGKHVRLASQPWDYVYGLREMLEPHFRQVFVPDYKLALPRLFEKLAAWLLIVDGWGEMLWSYPFRCPAGRPPELEGPSWVPDFSRRPQQLVNEPEPPKTLSEDIKTVQCAIVDRMLYIEGCRLDDVKEVIAIPAGNDCFQVLQKVWQLDRIYCSNQRPSCTTSQDRSACALLDWTSSTPSSQVPLLPRFWETRDVLRFESDQQLERCEAIARAEPTSDAVALYMRQSRGIVNLYSFCEDMECNFASACAFDFENLCTQLKIVSEAPDPQQGLDLILSSYGANEVVYEDLISAIHRNSGPGDVKMFRLLVDVVRRAADRIHNRVGRGDTRPDHSVRSEVKSSTAIAGIQKTIGVQKARISKLVNERNDVADSIGIEAETERDCEISSLKSEVSKAEKLLKWYIDNQARFDQLTNANDPGWSRQDEERAAQFKNREFFVTKAGFVGLTSPGVSGVRKGDRIVLLDGLSFPLIARACPDSRLTVVGCANVRGVKLHHKVEDVELWEGKSAGPKHIMAFV